MKWLGRKKEKEKNNNTVISKHKIVYLCVCPPWIYVWVFSVAGPLELVYRFLMKQVCSYHGGFWGSDPDYQVQWQEHLHAKPSHLFLHWQL